jgi:hypothetical protein
VSAAVPSRWLVISHQCGLDGRASSHHLSVRLPRLREQGIEPLVVTSCASPPDAAPFCRRVPCLSFSGLRQEVRLMAACRVRRPWVRSIVRAGLVLPLLPGHLLESALLRQEASWSWFASAGPVAAAWARRAGAGLIYSTSGAPSAHLAGWVCARLTGLPWLAEFQDPILFGNAQKPGERLYNAFVERIVAANADAVVFVTRGAMEQFERRQSLGGKGRVIYPGAEPVQAAPEPRGAGSGTLLIGHFGSLVMGRRPGPLLDALEHLARTAPRARASVRFWQKGHCDRQSRRELGSFAFPEMLRVEGAGPQSESLSAMRRCCLLAAIQHDGPLSSATIPSKVYEYLQTGVPVLGLTRANPELQSILVDLGHIAVDLRDTGAVRTALRAVYDEWRREGCLRRTPKASPFTVERACGELLDAAAGAVSRRSVRAGETGLEGCGSK